jgi:hypothetical protein
MDATRILDGRPVMLKKVLPADGPHELTINQLFSSPEHSRKRDNHCAPLLDVIELPRHFGSQKLMVFPTFAPFQSTTDPNIWGICRLLHSDMRGKTKFHISMYHPDTLSTQGIRFMHERNVAHRYESYDYT